MVFAVVGDRIYSAVDAKPKRTTALKRLANIETNPRVALLADAYAEDWTTLWWVRADGTARIIDSADAEAGRAIELLVAKYPQYREMRPTGSVIAIQVERWSGWTSVPHRRRIERLGGDGLQVSAVVDVSACGADRNEGSAPAVDDHIGEKSAVPRRPHVDVGPDIVVHVGHVRPRARDGLGLGLVYPCVLHLSFLEYAMGKYRRISMVRLPGTNQLSQTNVSAR